MTLVDTSVWVDHLRSGNRTLITLLEHDEVLTHPFVIGELACGRLRKRAEILRLLTTLPQVLMADHRDVMDFIDTHRLFRRGIGWVDAHLLASARLSHARLITLDSPLSRAAALAGVVT